MSIQKFILLAFSMFILCSSPLFANPVPYSFITIDDYTSSNNFALIDVRSEMSRKESNLEVEGEIWINPYREKPLEDFITSHDKDKPYAIFCSCIDDNYSIRAAQVLTKRGFINVKVLKGGWDSIKNSNLKLVKIKGDE